MELGQNRRMVTFEPVDIAQAPVDPMDQPAPVGFPDEFEEVGPPAGVEEPVSA